MSIILQSIIFGLTVAQELGVRLVIRRLPVRAPALTVSVVYLGKTLHLLPTGGGQRARWRLCPAASPLSAPQGSYGYNLACHHQCVCVCVDG